MYRSIVYWMRYEGNETKQKAILKKDMTELMQRAYAWHKVVEAGKKAGMCAERQVGKQHDREKRATTCREQEGSKEKR